MKRNCKPYRKGKHGKTIILKPSDDNKIQMIIQLWMCKSGDVVSYCIVQRTQLIYRGTKLKTKYHLIHNAINQMEFMIIDNNRGVCNLFADLLK